MLLGCIADDLTGATDLAGALVREGLRVALAVGVPDGPLDSAVDAVVVALKSRSIPPDAAVDVSLRALERLRAAGAERIYLKYASTFDSTPRGNIGPVTDALADALGVRVVVACPAFPENGRVLVDGELLVHGVPLAESSMRHHPLNPMRDSSVARLLAAQTPRAVALVDRAVVARGTPAIRSALETWRAAGARHAVVDAATHADLDAIASAVAAEPLVTGASALAAALARVVARSVAAQPRDLVQGLAGPAAIIAGSLSAATRAQIQTFLALHPAFEMPPEAGAGDPEVVEAAVAWARSHVPDGAVVVASAEPRGDPTRADGAAVERLLAESAAALVATGVRRLVVAGGETSGAVMERLGIRVLRVGAEIAPGVPVVAATEPVDLRLALKSGNFGSEDFFAVALDALASGTLAARGPASPPKRGEGS